MYPLFRRVSLLFIFQSAFTVNTASDKESLKKSLGHVGSFLENVNQSIQKEKYYIDKVTSELSNPIKENVDLDKNTNNNKTFNTKVIQSTNTNVKIDAILNKFDKHYLKNTNNNKKINSNDPKGVLGKENKIISAKQIVDDKNNVQIEPQNQIKAGKREKGKEEEKEEGKGRESDADIFGDMVFPPKSDLPDVGEKFPANNPKPVPGFVPGKFEEGPDPGILNTPTTTTAINDLLLNPIDYGLTTTHKPIPTYGDDLGSPSIDFGILTTPNYNKQEDHTPFVETFKKDMSTHGIGVFTATLLKMFHWMIFKKPKAAHSLAWGFGNVIEYYDNEGQLDSFGQPTKQALVYTTRKAGGMPADERRSWAILLHQALLNRQTMVSEEVTSILGYIDALYFKKETNDLIKCLEPLEEWNFTTGVPYTLLKILVQNILAPWRRIKDSIIGQTLKNDIKRAIKNRFYGPHLSGVGRVANQTEKKVLSRKHNKVNENYYNGENKYNKLKNKGTNDRRNDKNLKIINWAPDYTYRTNKNKDKNVQKHMKAKYNNSDQSIDDTFENDYQGIMNAITQPSRAVTTRNRTKDKIKNKRRIEIEKKPDRSQVFSKHQEIEEDPGGQSDNDHKSTHSRSKSTKKHHKKRHSKHRHKHSISSRSLAKLLKIIKYLRPHHKREKHRKHHHRSSSYWRRFRAVSSGNEKSKHKGKLSDGQKSLEVSEHEHTFNKANKKNKFYYETGKQTTFAIPTGDEFYKFETQAHDKSNLGFRRSMAIGKEFKKVQTLQKKIRAETSGSDEEILLKMNLIKAMGGEEYLDNVRKGNKNSLLDASGCSTDEEAFLKSQLYKYLLRS